MNQAISPRFVHDLQSASDLHPHSTCCTDESWLPVVGYPDYAVSTCGRIKRIVTVQTSKAGRILRARLRSGYPALGLWKDGRQDSKSVHRLVCEAFHGEPPTPLHQVAHGDGSRDNNHATNLRWATVRENAADRRDHGTVPTGDNHWSRISPASRPFGARNGTHTKPGKVPRGERNGSARLTADQVLAIRADPRRRKIVAAEHGISHVQVGFIQRRQAWSHVPEIAELNRDPEAMAQARDAATKCERKDA
jgi:hypothetical protein